MTTVYEGMFLLDNQVVREDWKKAKAIITDALKKHGAQVLCARRFDERKLAYPIRRRRRATYCLAFYQMGSEGQTALRRDFELNENVLRYLMLARENLPEGELELAAAEDAADFNVPTPPPDDAPDAPGGGRRREGGEAGGLDELGEARLETRDGDVEDGDVPGKDD